MTDRATERVETSATGGRKGQKLAQLSAIDPLALTALAEVAGMGADKYDRMNYLRGYPWHLCMDALQRHTLAFWAGEDTDPESGRPHMAHAAWHALALVSFLVRHIGDDDRPDRPDSDWDGLPIAPDCPPHDPMARIPGSRWVPETISRESYLTLEGRLLAAETAARGYRERAERAEAALKESISITNKWAAAWSAMRAERDALIVERDDLILELDDCETQTRIREEQAFLSGRHVGSLQMVDLLFDAHAERDTLQAERDTLEGKFLAAEKAGGA